jgi:hypothetical protein
MAMSEDLERIRASIEQIEHKISRIEDRVCYPLGEIRDLLKEITDFLTAIKYAFWLMVAVSVCFRIYMLANNKPW